MSNLWLLFDTGGYLTVDCSLHDPLPGSSRPVDGFVVSESQGDFTIAAKNATHAVFTCLNKRGKDFPPKTAGFGLAERTCDNVNISGESGGLCFAVAFANALLNIETPDIAATGVIHSNGRIDSVTGLDNKLETASNLVSENGFVFYPEKNNYTLPDDVQQRFDQKNIHCHSVSHLNEVIDKLIQISDRTGKTSLPAKTITPPSNKLIIAMLILAFIIALFAGYWIPTLKIPTKFIKTPKGSNYQISEAPLILEPLALKPESETPVLNTSTNLESPDEKPLSTKTSEPELFTNESSSDESIFDKSSAVQSPSDESANDYSSSDELKPTDSITDEMKVTEPIDDSSSTQKSPAELSLLELPGDQQTETQLQFPKRVLPNSMYNNNFPLQSVRPKRFPSRPFYNKNKIGRLPSQSVRPRRFPSRSFYNKKKSATMPPPVDYGDKLNRQ